MAALRLDIEERRKAKGWGQTELAKRSGVSRVTIARIEAGQTQGVDFETLEKLAAAFGEQTPSHLIVRVAAKAARKRSE